VAARKPSSVLCLRKLELAAKIAVSRMGWAAPYPSTSRKETHIKSSKRGKSTCALPVSFSTRDRVERAEKGKVKGGKFERKRNMDGR
jgi:stalled ribosome alternative rescue factor ArfA